MLARMAGKQSRRPQFVGIAEFLGLAAGEVDNPCLGLGGDRRLPAGPRAIVERRHRTPGQRPFDAALNGLMVRAHDASYLKEGRLVPIGQQHSCSLDPARRFASRTRNRAQSRQVLLAHRQFDRLPPSRHDRNPRFRIKAQRLQAVSRKMNPAHMIGFKESKN